MRIVRYYPRAVAGDGGITGAVRRWSEAFARQGATSVIAFLDGSGEPPAQTTGITWAPVRHVGVNGYQAPTGLRSVLRGADVLVLHSAWTAQNVAAAAVARRMRVPYILEPRGAYDPHIVSRRASHKRAWWRLAEGPLVKRARAVHMFFEEERPHLAALGYRGPVVVAPNGAGAPPGHEWDGGSGGYIAWLGRFDPEHKGLDLLVQGLAQLPEADRLPLRLYGPDWRGQRQGVSDMIDTMGLRDWVSMRPPVHGAEKYEVLSKAKAFVYPSRWEAFGNSVVEAACLGVPLAVTQYPLGSYLAKRSAAVQGSASPSGVADALHRIAQPDSGKVGARAREIAHHDFAWDTVAKAWITQVEALL
ncbi:MAG: glycosyltransferase [Actinomycetota bacterium]|nr:glycosyltransferase [Actinomycetota bacterium]